MPKGVTWCRVSTESTCPMKTFNARDARQTHHGDNARAVAKVGHGLVDALRQVMAERKPGTVRLGQRLL